MTGALVFSRSRSARVEQGAEKRPAAKGTAKSKGAALAGMAFTQAIQVLQDEKTRAMIVEQYQTISEQARKWRSERRAEADAEDHR